jgi:hypothetical protein
MLTDDDVLGAVDAAEGAGAAVSSLVAMANARGGHDNISVVLVRPAGTILEAAASEEGVPSPAEISGQLDVIPIDRSDAHDDDVADVDPGVLEAAAHDDAAMGASQVPGQAPPAPPSRAEQRRARQAARRAWLLKRSALLVTLLVVAVVIGSVAWSQSYFLTTHDGRVAIDRGFPFLAMSKEYRTSEVDASELSKAERARYLDDHTLRGKADAERLLRRMPELAGRCDPSGSATKGDPTSTQLPDPACEDAAGQ